MTTQSTSNRPVAELVDGAMKLPIFRNEPKQDGDKVRFSGKLSRSYRDSQGQWHNTEYLSGSEYLRAANLLIQAYNKELELKQAERQQTAINGEQA